MKKETNGMAIAGFTLCVCSVPMLAAGFLCLIGLILVPILSVVFGEMAGLAAIFGLALCGIGLHRSYQDGKSLGGLSVAGIVIGTVIVTMVLALTALMIVNHTAGLGLPLAM